MPEGEINSRSIPQKLLWGIIASGTIITIIFAALVLRQESTPASGLPSPKGELLISVINGITVSTDLPKGTVEPALSFIKQTVAETLVPNELMIRLFQKGSTLQGDTFLGTWNQNGKFLSLLVGLTRDNLHIQYLRVWATPAGSSITKKDAQGLLTDHFSSGFLSTFSTWDCEATESANRKEHETRCTVLESTGSGDLTGFSVQAPFRLEPPSPDEASAAADLILVSACKIPSDTRSTFTATKCI